MDVATQKNYIVSIGTHAKRMIFHTALALTFTSGLSYIAGAMRDRLLAQRFGAGDELDAYFAALVVPDIITAVLVTSVVGVCFVPLFTGEWKKDPEKAAIFTYSILFFFLLFISAVIIIAILCAPLIASLIAPGYEGEQRETYIRLMQVLLFGPLIWAVTSFFGGVLLSTRDYFFYGIAPVFYNLGIIAGLYMLEPRWGIYGVAVGTLFGVFLHMMSRFVIGIGRVGFTTYMPKVKIWGNALIWEALKLSWPKMIHLGAWNGLLAWFTYLALSTQSGGVTIYNYARNFQSMPVSLIGIAIGLTAFTSLSIAVAHNNLASFKDILLRKMFLVFSLTFVAALALNAVAPTFLTYWLGGGKFSESAIEQTIFLLQVYVWSIPLESLVHVLARANYALKRTFIPSVINILTIGLMIFASKEMIEVYKLKAIPYAFFSGLLVQNLLLYLSLRYYLTKHQGKKQPFVDQVKSIISKRAS